MGTSIISIYWCLVHQLKVGWGLADLGWANVRGGAGWSRLDLAGWLCFLHRPSKTWVQACSTWEHSKSSCGLRLPEGSSYDHGRSTGCRPKPKKLPNWHFCVIALTKASHMAKTKPRGKEVYSLFTGEVPIVGLGFRSKRHSLCFPCLLPSWANKMWNVEIFINASFSYHFGHNSNSLIF